MSGDPKVPADFSFLSPPTFVQPLPDHPPVSSLKQKPLPIPSPHQVPLPSMSLPSIILHQDNDLDLFITDDLPTQGHINPTVHDHSDSSIYNYSDPSGSGTSAQLPLSSNVQSEVSSAVASDLDLPPLSS